MKIFKRIFQEFRVLYLLAREIIREILWKFEAKKNHQREKIISLFDNHVLVDVGASYFSPKTWNLALKSPSSRLIAIDPNGDNLDYLKYNNQAKVTLIREAVGRRLESRILYKTPTDSGSSLYRPRLSQEFKLKSRVGADRGLFPYQEIEITTVPLLDAIGELSDNDLLWIKLDTQGTELEILEGSRELLIDDRTTLVEMEVSLMADPVMEGSAKLPNVVIFMESCGFEMTHINVIHSNSQANSIKPYIKRGYLAECDVLFTRRLINFQEWPIQRKIAIFLAYISYGLVDLAIRVANNDNDLYRFLSPNYFDFSNPERLVNQIESILDK